MPLWGYHIVFIHFSHWVFSPYFLAIMNSTAMNTYVQGLFKYLFSVLLGVDIEMELLWGFLFCFFFKPWIDSPSPL